MLTAPLWKRLHKIADGYRDPVAAVFVELFADNAGSIKRDSLIAALQTKSLEQVLDLIDHATRPDPKLVEALGGVFQELIADAGGLIAETVTVKHNKFIGGPRSFKLIAREWRAAFDPDQERDEQGRWVSDDGGETEEDESKADRYSSVSKLHHDYIGGNETLKTQQEIVSSFHRAKEKGEAVDDERLFNAERKVEEVLDRRAALVDYTGDGYTDINHAIREMGGIHELSKNPPMVQARTLSKMIEESPELPQPVSVFRGVRNQRDLVYQPGDVLEMKGLTSTSTDPLIASDFTEGRRNAVIFEIKTKRGLVVGTHGKPHEKEVILNHGWKYKVHSITKMKAGPRTYTTVRLLPVVDRLGAASINFRFDTRDPDARDWAREHAADLITQVTKTTREKIKDLVTDAFDGEYSITELTDEIEELVNDPGRADRIARTETMAAANKGQLAAWDQAVGEGLIDEDAQKTWVTTPDDRLCPVCEPLDGVSIPLSDMFDVDGENLDGPPAHPNCRCVLGLSS